jgi:DNA repair ATPase RecN
MFRAGTQSERCSRVSESLALIVGQAGTGKSCTISAIRDVYDAEGCDPRLMAGKDKTMVQSSFDCRRLPGRRGRAVMTEPVPT